MATNKIIVNYLIINVYNKIYVKQKIIFTLFLCY